ncbi:hypothetical protein [Embleya sp. NPDC059237]|uniref:hypothetical protein n=1 Tax=Embleya sp. NPDC059237 TaxID=3346784 RepID=UPI0036A81F34
MRPRTGERPAAGEQESHPRRELPAHAFVDTMRAVADVTGIAVAGIDMNAVYRCAAAAEAHRHPGGQVTVGNMDFDVARSRDTCAYAMPGSLRGSDLDERRAASDLLGCAMLQPAGRRDGDNEAPPAEPRRHVYPFAVNRARARNGNRHTIAAGGRDPHRQARVADVHFLARPYREPPGDDVRVRRNAWARGPDVLDGYRGNIPARDPTRDVRIRWRRDGADGPIPTRAWITTSRGPNCDADHSARAVAARADRIAHVRPEPLATHELHERAEASAGMRARPLILRARRYAVHADGTEHDACERATKANARLHTAGRTRARIVAGPLAVRAGADRADTGANPELPHRARATAETHHLLRAGIDAHDEPATPWRDRPRAPGEAGPARTCETTASTRTAATSAATDAGRIEAGTWRVPPVGGGRRCHRARTTPRRESRRRHPAGRCVPPGHMFRRHVVRQQVRQEE